MLLLDKHLYISTQPILKIFPQVHGDRLRTGHRFDGIPHALRPHAAGLDAEEREMVRPALRFIVDLHRTEDVYKRQ